MPTADQIRQKYNETFMQDEKDVIEMCIANGHWNSVSSALDGIGKGIETPVREHALEDYLNLRKPAPMPEGSAVRLEMQKLEQEKGAPLIETPEEEAYWQKRLDDEQKEADAKQKAKTEGLEPEPVKEEVKEDARTKKEITDALKEKGIKFDPNKKKAELAELLDAPEAAPVEKDIDEYEDEA